MREAIGAELLRLAQAEVDCRADDFLPASQAHPTASPAAIAAQLALASRDSRLQVRMGFLRPQR